MGKGFLSRLLQKLAGAPPAEKAALPSETLEDVLVLDPAWAGKDALIQLAAFMQPYSRAASGLQYFMMLSRVQSGMVRGKLPFFYPKPGVYNYPEKDLVFAEHCYIPASHLVKIAYDCHDRHEAILIARALVDATTGRQPESPEKLAGRGFALEGGQTAAQNFFVSAYEAGSSFATVLRRRPEAGQGTRPRPGGPV